MSRPVITSEMRTEAHRLRKLGWIEKEIAARLGLGRSTVHDILKPPVVTPRRIRPADEQISVSIPPDRLELRALLAALPYPPSLSLMGDPQPGRRELIERYR